MIYINTQCLFCFKQFTRPRKAREHVKKLHLKYYKLDDLILCPHLVCRMDEVVLGGGDRSDQPVDGQSVGRHTDGDHAVGKGGQAEFGGIGESLHRRAMLAPAGGQCADNDGHSPGYRMRGPELSTL